MDSEVPVIKEVRRNDPPILTGAAKEAYQLEELRLHRVAIAPKAAGVWGTYCIDCSDRAKEYTRCDFIRNAPREVIEYKT